MKSVYLTKEDCCGYSACYSVCAKQAITMKADEEGLLYPELDQTRCIDCGRCIQICPLIHEGNYKNDRTPRNFSADKKQNNLIMARFC